MEGGEIMEDQKFCFSCNKSDHEKGALYCSNCGFELDSNHCTNERCNANNGQCSVFPEDACYCDLCGTETSYFLNDWIRPKVYEKQD